MPIREFGTIPILSNILLEASGERLDITATDLDVSIRCGCAALVAAGGIMTLSARRLFDIVRLLPEEAELHFNLLENDWVEIRAGNSEYKVVGLPNYNPSWIFYFNNNPLIASRRHPMIERALRQATDLLGTCQRRRFA